MGHHTERRLGQTSDWDFHSSFRSWILYGQIEVGLHVFETIVDLGRSYHDTPSFYDGEAPGKGSVAHPKHVVVPGTMVVPEHHATPCLFL